MTDSSRRRRLLGRRLQVIRHAPPEEALAAMLEPPTDTLPAVPDPALEALAAIEATPPAPADVSRETCRCATLRPGAACPAHPFDPRQYVAGGQVPIGDETTWVDEKLAAAVLEGPPPPLSRDRINRLEALTAQWVRDMRVGGPGPEDTLLYSGGGSLPPVPPARQDPRGILEPPPPAVPTPEEAQAATEWNLREALEETPHQRVVREHVAAVEAARPPARVSDWRSRHDPRSLEYALRDRLARPVPLQDVLLERGPILDQGTTPPLSVRDASACVGMASVAAANVLELAAGRPVHLGVDDARRAYHRSQQLDAISGEAYAGTSVLAGMKAGQEAGWWDSYLWALAGSRDVAQALLQFRAPVVVGVPWTTGLEEPDRHGVIRPTGTPAGGHALAVIGLRLQLRLARADRLQGPFFVLQQSRGESEGDAGLVYLHHADLSRMLAGVGEAAVPILRGGLS